MTNRIRVLISLSVFICVAQAAPTLGADIYVNPGSSITNAMAAAGPGDTVHVNAGTYHENVAIGTSGTSSAYISLVANGAVLIDAGGAGKALRIAANYIIVNGFECTNFLEGLNMRTAHIKVLNCNFHSGPSNSNPVAGSNGLTVNFDSPIDDIDIENSNFYYNDAGGADFGCNNTTDVLSNITLINCKFYANNCLGGTDGIGIGHQGTKSNITLIHCQAYDNLSDGFDLDAPVYMEGCIAHDNDRNGGPSWGVGMKAWGHTGNPPVYGMVRLYNCLSYNNTEESAGGGGINVGGVNSIVSNCLVSGNNSYAGIIICSGASLTIKNTIFYKEHYSISSDSDVSGLNFDSSNVIYNCTSNGALSPTAAAQAKSFDPLFVNPVDNDSPPWADFHLQSSSPAIDAGVSVSGVTEDADGNPRPSGNGFDIGPYEYQSTVVAKPVISSATSASGTVGTAFSYTISASNTPTSYNATGLPSGLSVSTSTGVISGTPSAAGTSTITLSATNSGGTGTATLTLTINAAKPPAPVISSATSSSGTVGTAFSYTISASNSPSSYNATSLPSGLSVNTSTGVISGTPSAPGTSSVALSATNSGGTGTATLTLTINAAKPPAPVISSATSANGIVGTAFNYTISASNSPTSYNATGLPSGLSVNTSTGVISGTPTTSGASSVALSATNSGGTGTATLTLTINTAKPPAPVISSSTSANGTVGTAFSYTISASNTPTSYNATGLPSGLSVNTSTGVISGTPTTAGASSVALSATNSGGTGTATLTLTINAVVLPPVPVISSATSAAGTVGTAFTYTISASNSPASFNATGLPAGLSVNTSTGIISGTPTVAGTSSIALSATNTGGTGTATLSLTINAATTPPPVIASPASATPNPAAPGTNVTFFVSASSSTDDTLTYAWNFGDGSTGTGAGPSHAYTAVGAYAVTVTVSDSHGGTANSSVNVNVVTAIDSGGRAAGRFAADQSFSGGNTYKTSNAIKTAGVTNPAPQAVYQSERYGNFTYTISNLTNGAAYTVRLHFAEIWWNAAGSRVFNVSINGTQVLTNFDIYAAAGGKFVALVKSFNAIATNGQILITYTTVKDNAKSSGIEIISASNVLATDAITSADSVNSSIDLGTVNVGKPFKLTLEAPESGKNAKLHWSVVPGSKLLPGVAVRSGQIGGRPKTAGTYTFNLQIKTKGTSVTNTYTITVVP